MSNVTPGQNSAVCLGHDRFSSGYCFFFKIYKCTWNDLKSSKKCLRVECL